ncbi:MAG: hypothetical protein K0R38_3520 [Polyangiaceae bacterium]|jgi:hypothetical protein|nr:hypothetical protein [Polyangiaceae bacterium]
MPASPDDDFCAFEGREHMFFGLRDPFGLIRSEVEDALRAQIADTEVLSIATLGEPKFLTLGRKAEDEKVIVTHFGFAVRAKLTVLFDERRKGELIDALLTFLFGDVDTNEKRYRRFIDVHEEAERGFDDAAFKERFLAFRQGAK